MGDVFIGDGDGEDVFGYTLPVYSRMSSQDLADYRRYYCAFHILTKKVAGFAGHLLNYFDKYYFSWKITGNV